MYRSKLAPLGLLRLTGSRPKTRTEKIRSLCEGRWQNFFGTGQQSRRGKTWVNAQQQGQHGTDRIGQVGEGQVVQASRRTSLQNRCIERGAERPIGQGQQSLTASLEIAGGRNFCFQTELAVNARRQIVSSLLLENVNQQSARRIESS